MITKVQKWGNSLALRIPKSFADDVQLENDSAVDINIVKGKIIITPIAPPQFALEDLLNAVNKKNIHEEIQTGSVKGKEIW
jgi:antitoxin MazE